MCVVCALQGAGRCPALDSQGSRELFAICMFGGQRMSYKNIITLRIRNCVAFKELPRGA